MHWIEGLCIGPRGTRCHIIGLLSFRLSRGVGVSHSDVEHRNAGNTCNTGVIVCAREAVLIILDWCRVEWHDRREMISLPSSAFYTDNPTTRYLYIAKRRVYGPICSISFIGQLKRPKFSERLVWLYYYLKEVSASQASGSGSGSIPNAYSARLSFQGSCRRY